MSAHIHRMDSEDQETMFHSYPCSYYVQSPSTLSHANSDHDHHISIKPTNLNLLESTIFLHSPTRSDNAILLNKNNALLGPEDVSRFTLSHYSSSRGSNNSFLNDKKVVISGGGEKGAVNRLVIVDRHGFGGDTEEEAAEEEEEGEEYYSERKIGGYFSFRRSNSCAWISLQICWRVLFSLGIALLVFYVATKPPPPKISIKMARIQQFGLGEGVDGSGVATKILTCNCTMNLLIENKSKLFGLHIHPPILEMSFGRLPLAMSRGSKLYAESHGRTLFKLYVGTRNKPMYGAGRNMQDMLESGNGLPIMVRMSFRSNYRVVWELIKPKFNHQAQCLLLLDSKYDKKHRTQAYTSTCTLS